MTADFVQLNQLSEESWHMVVDSGCSETILETKELFRTYGPSTKRIGSAINSITMKAVGEGLISLPVTATDGTTTHINVTALRCPDARRNLLSLAGALNAGWLANFKNGAGSMRSPDNKEVKLRYHRDRNLWFIDLKDSEDEGIVGGVQDEIQWRHDTRNTHALRGAINLMI